MNCRCAATEAGGNMLYFTYFFSVYLELHKIMLLLVLMKCCISPGCTVRETGCSSKIEKGA